MRAHDRRRRGSAGGRHVAPRRGLCGPSGTPGAVADQWDKPGPVGDEERAMTAEELLMEARAVLPPRPSPAEAYAAQGAGALLIDIRGHDQWRHGGQIPGALLLARNVLEWRCDPVGRWRHPAMTGTDQRLILICEEGFQSSLAAAALQRLGLVHATDLDGGF